MTLATRLLQTRKDRGMTQRDLTMVSGVSRANISQIEHGRVTKCEARTVLSLAAALGVRPEWLWQGIGQRELTANGHSNNHSMVLREVLVAVLTLIVRNELSVNPRAMTEAIDLLIDLRSKQDKPLSPELIARYVALGTHPPD